MATFSKHNAILLQFLQHFKSIHYNLVSELNTGKFFNLENT